MVFDKIYDRRADKARDMIRRELENKLCGSGMTAGTAGTAGMPPPPNFAGSGPAGHGGAGTCPPNMIQGPPTCEECPSFTRAQEGGRMCGPD